jgi:hypothetical protein
MSFTGGGLVFKKVSVLILIAACTLTVTAFALDAFFLAWVGWGLIFGTMEWYGLRRSGKLDTLSEQIWLGTRSKTLYWAIFWRVGIVVFLSWLTVHFLIGR